MRDDFEMAYKYQYNPAATDNVSLQDNGRNRGRSAAGSLTYRSSNNRMRRTDNDEETSLGTKCCFGFLFLIAQIFLHGALVLILFWICWFRWNKNLRDVPFIWPTGDETNEELEMTFNLHPFLMIAGFIYLMGQGMLVYRTGTCCKRLVTKLIHTMFHVLAIPCIAIGFYAIWEYKNLRKNEQTNESSPVPHFYSIHSWLGLATMGMFTLQLIVGLFSFLALLACESGTARFRAGLVPIHAIMGTATFILAIATGVCGLTEKALFDLSVNYSRYMNQIDGLSSINLSESIPLFLNVAAGCLGALAIIMPLILWYPKFRFRSEIA